MTQPQVGGGMEVIQQGPTLRQELEIVTDNLFMNTSTGGGVDQRPSLKAKQPPKLLERVQ